MIALAVTASKAWQRVARSNSANQTNVGREKAQEAAQAIRGLAVLPPFERGGQGSGWNDFAQITSPEFAQAAYVRGNTEAEQDLLAQRQILGRQVRAGQESGTAIDQ